MLSRIRECVGVGGAYRDGVFARTVTVIVDLVHGVRGLEHRAGPPRTGTVFACRVTSVQLYGTGNALPVSRRG